jgi:signal transduction histidine kinase
MRRWRQFLLPRDERSDPAFREEVTRLSGIGLKAIVWICLCAPSFMLAVTLVLNRLGFQSGLWVWQDFAIMATGLAAAPFGSHGSRLRRHARLVGVAVGYCVALVFIVTLVAAPHAFYGAENAVPMNITLVMLVGIAALPLQPMQTLGLGLALWTTYLGAVVLFPEQAFIADETPLFLGSLVVVTLICTGLTAVVYHQRAEAFQARQQVLKAQARLTLSESAAAQGRLAAALSHELNSPIGIINSNLDTISLVLEKYRAPEEPKERLMETLSNVATSAKRSCGRLAELVARMQRFTNLDRAEKAAVDLSTLLADTVDILRAEIQRRAEITMRLEPLPRICCRPQEMSAVFSNLLLNSAAAIVDRGRIDLRSEVRKGEIVIEIDDDGQGIAKDKLAHIFEPSFTVSERRVSTTNWGLFNCRNIIVGLGGEIQIESVEGKGTKVRVVLPLLTG